MERGGPMKALLAIYHSVPGNADTIEATLRAMAEAVRRDEPTCLAYHAARSTEDPDTFILYEVYRDEAALIAHRETPHFSQLIEGTIVPLLSSRERQILIPIASTGLGGGS